jgi:hypothetical protein
MSHKVAYNVINATDSFLLALKGFRDPDFLEEHCTCEEIASKTVGIKKLVSIWPKWRNDVGNEAVFGTIEMSDDDSGDDSEESDLGSIYEGWFCCIIYVKWYF